MSNRDKSEICNSEKIPVAMNGNYEYAFLIKFSFLIDRF